MRSVHHELMIEKYDFKQYFKPLKTFRLIRNDKAIPEAPYFVIFRSVFLWVMKCACCGNALHAIKPKY